MRNKSNDAQVKEIVSRLLNKRRDDLGLTYQDVADAAGMSLGNAHNIMNGKHNCNVLVLQRITKAMNWSIQELFLEVDNELGNIGPTHVPELRKLLAQHRVEGASAERG